MEIELTSTRPDGSWNWRAAGAREPKGVMPSDLVPAGRGAGDVLRVEADFEIDGITIVTVLPDRAKEDRPNQRLELLPTERPFEAVTQQLASKGRGDRADRPRRDRGERGDRPDRPRGERGERGDRRERGDRSERGERSTRERDSRGPRTERAPGDGERRRPRDDSQRGRRGPFTAPPELPSRPKPRRLKPGRTHRTEVLTALPEAHRTVAERVLQGGIPAVRQAVKEQNDRLRAEGKEEIPAQNLLDMAERLLPKLRVAEWRDRAEAALKDLELLDLRDLRSVVVASDDPVVARDDSTRELAAQLREALVTKQEREHQQWLDDILAALAVGRVVRALKLSSQPPKAGVPFPADVAAPLVAAASAALTPVEPQERWVALLEAAAFSPVHTSVTVQAPPAAPGDELISTVKRLAVLLPQVATALSVELPAPGTPAPKPLRPARPTDQRRPSRPTPAKPAKTPGATVAVSPEQATAPTEQATVPAEPVQATAPAEPVTVPAEPAVVPDDTTGSPLEADHS